MVDGNQSSYLTGAYLEGLSGASNPFCPMLPLFMGKNWKFVKLKEHFSMNRHKIVRSS